MKPSTVNQCSITKHSDVVLSKWMMWEVNAKTHHLVGHVDVPTKDKMIGYRVTSKIVDWDPVSNRFRSTSGKIYRVSGPPEESLDTIPTWNRWQEKYKVKTALLVSNDYFVTMYQAYLALKQRKHVKAV